MLRLLARFATFLIAACALSTGVSATFDQQIGAVVTTPRVRAQLMAYAPDGVAPGKPLWLGLQLTHIPGWHTYWKNSGDSGLPTELKWTLPPGLTAGDIAWPAPQKIRIGQLANYGYEGTVLLPVPVTVTVAPDFKPGAGGTGAALGNLTGGASGADTVQVRLQADWLVCRKECIPEQGEFALSLPVRGSSALDRAEFDAALAAQPVALAGAASATIDGDALALSVAGLPSAVQGHALEFFSEVADLVQTGAVAGSDWTQAWDGATWTARVPLAAQRSASPRELPLVLTLAGAARDAATPAAPRAWRTVATVEGAWGATAPRAQVSPALQAALSSNRAATATTTAPVPAAPAFFSLAYALALAGALVGGLLLNLMPCVFPVLAIKVLNFARQAGNQGAHRRAALAYTGGVLATLLALAGAMLALRAGGAQLGWGFQLQSPAVVAALAALFTLIGLNLAGVFEFGMVAPQALRSARAQHPVADDFLAGVLAVVVASPCTAPFMGAALGLAIALPAPQALLLFGVLGLGLALPYLLAGFVPGAARLLPRPGAWMQTLRRLLAFPMFATVAWLVWVLGQQTGIDGAGALLALLVAGAAVLWASTLRGAARLALGGVLAAAFAGLALLLGPALLREAPPDSANVAVDARWQPWSASRVAQLQAEGRPVFIDYTAAWCVTCQVNKRVLDDGAVLAGFDAKRVVLLRADWTRRDADISAALAKLGRSGVPVYVLQVPGRAPQVLTELLRKDDLLNAIAAL